MFQKFFTDTYISKFIKALLANTELPMYDAVCDGDFILKDEFYIYNSSLIRCKTSGTLPDATYDVIERYLFGDKRVKYTRPFYSKYGYYDSETHTKLGEYLRTYKSCKDIDLLQYYNCFNGEYRSDLFIDPYVLSHMSDIDPQTGQRHEIIDKVNYYTEKTNNNYKIAQIPIKFNKTYTIAVDCNEKVLMLPIVTDHGVMTGMITESGEQKNITDVMLEQGIGGVVTHYGMQFKNPVTYSISIDQGNDDYLKSVLHHSEKYLRLLIQLPANNNSSIVVIEGDAFTGKTKQCNVENLQDFTPQEKMSYYTSNLSLLRINDGNRYAFSNRLIEFLLGNAIDQYDLLDNNFEVFKADLIDYSEKLGDGNDKIIQENVPDGVWSDYLRYFAFKYAMESKEIEKIDISGFYDKDVESIFQKGE